MFYKHSHKNKKYILPIFVIFIIAGVLFIVWSKFSNNPKQIYCTQEAKLCSDGSYVGRTGLKCEFSACPVEDNNLWKTATQSGVTFQYPETLFTKYIHTIDWPPQVQVLNKPFTCTGAGEENTRAGQTMKITVSDRVYCVTKESEGVAGSIYTNYAYAFPSDDKTIIFTFSLRTVQCANYDDPEKIACENERLSFDLDSTIDRIAISLKF